MSASSHYRALQPGTVVDSGYGLGNIAILDGVQDGIVPLHLQLEVGGRVQRQVDALQAAIRHYNATVTV